MDQRFSTPIVFIAIIVSTAQTVWWFDNRNHDMNQHPASPINCSKSEVLKTYPKSTSVSEILLPQPQYREVEYTALETITPARTERRVIPAKYKWITVKVFLREEYYQVVLDPSGRFEIGQEFIPAEFIYEKRKVLVAPQQEEIITIPAERRLVRKTKLVPVTNDSNNQRI